ncbi:MAG: T9SS type A sorting domain-containing protein [Ignavibacteriales bacterium]|nr:T9SS type A sorting domain-containing protein [Ignavibacteriales bacterium]
MSTPAREKSTYESKSAIITKAGDDEPFVVGKGTTITFVAGEEIRLTGEFKAEEGSQFRASISEIAMSNLDSESENLRIQFELSQNYPNPFNPETVIQYSVPTSEAVFQVTLKLYDITGREVATFVNAEQKAGRYEIKFNGQRFSSGIYFYRLSVIQEGSKSDLTDVKKMMLIK